MCVAEAPESERPGYFWLVVQYIGSRDTILGSLHYSFLLLIFLLPTSTVLFIIIFVTVMASWISHMLLCPSPRVGWTATVAPLDDQGPIFVVATSVDGRNSVVCLCLCLRDSLSSVSGFNKQILGQGNEKMLVNDFCSEKK